jgi:hypothetical protein
MGGRHVSPKVKKRGNTSLKPPEGGLQTGVFVHFAPLGFKKILIMSLGWKPDTGCAGKGYFRRVL